MELSDMWLHLEATMADIWRGEDAATQMQEFCRSYDRAVELKISE